jgi:hypothetical protein
MNVERQHGVRERVAKSVNPIVTGKDGTRQWLLMTILNYVSKNEPGTGG